MAELDPTVPSTTPRPRSSTPHAPRRLTARAAFLLALALTLLAANTGVAAEMRDAHPNLLGGELGGRGFLVTANYERFLTDHFAVGGGVTLGPLLSLYAAYLPGETSSLYLAAGGTFVGGYVFLDSQNISLILQGSVGYQFQHANGFFVRPLVNFNMGTAGEGVFPVWPGVTIGRAF
jgi:hypothetical protein